MCQRSTTAGRKGCTMPPLLNIPFEFVVVDTLHLFLRIMGLLFHQVSPQASYKEMPFSHANPFEIFEGENRHLLILCYLLSQYRLLRLLSTMIAQTFCQKKWREFRWNSSFMRSTTDWQKKTETKWTSLNGTLIS